jgi:cephalosporin hydroxylase
MLRSLVRQEIDQRLRAWVIDQFHRYWYDAPDSWQKSHWLGFGLKQLPFDLQNYHDILWEMRPACVVQTGVSEGGSMAFFAHMMDALGAPPEALVIGIDITLGADARRLAHPRIRLIEGSSTEASTLDQVRSLLPAGARGLVSLDSDHSRDHVLAEMRLYAEFVPVGGYMVVEDTNINGHPVLPGLWPGPYEAVDDFLATRSDFVHDHRWRRLLFSFHHHGWLRRVR